MRKAAMLAEFKTRANIAWNGAAALHGEWVADFARFGRPETPADVAHWQRVLMLLREDQHTLQVLGFASEARAVGIMIQSVQTQGEPPL